jgi:hypothetical protein
MSDSPSDERNGRPVKDGRKSDLTREPAMLQSTNSPRSVWKGGFLILRNQVPLATQSRLARAAATKLSKVGMELLVCYTASDSCRITSVRRESHRIALQFVLFVVNGGTLVWACELLNREPIRSNCAILRGRIIAYAYTMKPLCGAQDGLVSATFSNHVDERLSQPGCVSP